MKNSINIIRKKGVICFFTFFILYSCEEILLEVDITNEVPELLAPTNSSVLPASNILFDWNKVEGASLYRIQIVSPSFDEVDQFLVNELIEETSFSKNLTAGNFEWKITAVNGGYESNQAKASFEVENSEGFSALEVKLVEPIDGEVSNDASQVLKWEEIDNASTYRLNIFEDDELIFERSFNETSAEYTFENGIFSWQVRAETEIESTFYSKNSITIDTIDPEVAELISPVNDTIFTNNTINFEWERENTSGTVVVDSIYIYNDPDLESLVDKNTGTGSSYTALLDRNKTYYWLIRSFDEAGNESRSQENFSFTIN